MEKRRFKFPKWSMVLAIAVVASTIGGLFVVNIGMAAYNHNGDIDSANFRAVYSDTISTKLDSCTTCHSGGSYTSSDKTTTLGSCQWCHYKTSYGDDASETNLLSTLNQYGIDYKNNGRTAAALVAIQNLHSDADGYTNLVEINGLTYPGDSSDSPANIMAPSRIFTLEELERLPQYSQFMLMNASKSDDEYVEYSGIILEDLIGALKLDSATGITVFAPDGFATYHPFSPSSDPNSYHVFGTYPSSVFYYNEQGDMAKNPSSGWVDYSAPSAVGRSSGDLISNSLGLKMLLAFKRDGQYLTPGILNSGNKLDGEGPYRIVPPQKNPGPPDQRSTVVGGTWVWPYVKSADHNAGFSSRSVTMIRVDPMPAGTTDINIYEAGWPYIDEAKIIIYGAINPDPEDNMVSRLTSLTSAIQDSPDSAFLNKSYKNVLINKSQAINNQIGAGAYNGALKKLQEDIIQKLDRWVTDQTIRQELYSAANQIQILLVLAN